MLSKTISSLFTWDFFSSSFHPWNVHNDISIYETNFIIHTRTHHHHSIRHDNHAESSQFNTNNDENMMSILERIEQNLIHTNEQIDLYEKQIQNHQKNLFSPYIHFILVVSVAIILKYIFQWMIFFKVEQSNMDKKKWAQHKNLKFRVYKFLVFSKFKLISGCSLFLNITSRFSMVKSHYLHSRKWGDWSSELEFRAQFFHHG